MPANVIDAKGTDKKDSQKPKGIEKTIYIGVFFDGTCNNKFQVAIGKYFRFKEDCEAASKGSKTAENRLHFGRDANSADNWFIENSIHTADIYDLPTSDMNPKEGSVGQGNVAEMPNNSDSWFKTDRYSDISSTYKSDYDKEFKKVEKNPYEIPADLDNNIGVKSDTADISMTRDEYFTKEYKSSKGADGQEVDTYTNVAILEALYEPQQCAPDEFFPLYIEGPGTDLNFEGVPIFSKAGDKVSKVSAQAAGKGSLGVEAKVQKAIKAVRNICKRFTSQTDIEKLNVHLSTYGFSRGATEARMFSSHSYDKNRSKDEAKKDLLGASVAKKVKELVLDFVGLFDSVSSVGIGISDGKGKIVHKSNARDLKLWAIDHAKTVLHLCAMDEHRANFALTDIENCIGSVGTEFFMPGCHTDVGGACTIGMEKDFVRIDMEVEYTYFLVNYWTEHHYMWMFKPCSSGGIAPVSIDTLDKMGWIDKNRNINFDEQNEKAAADKVIEAHGGAYKTGSRNIEAIHRHIQIRQYVKPGYSNIALHLMHTKAQEYTFFKTIPNAYKVAGGLLSTCCDRWKGSIGGSGRKMAKLSNTEYQALRRDYLRISQQGGFGEVINDPSFEKKSGSMCDKVIMRVVYKGVSNGGTRFMDELSYA